MIDLRPATLSDSDALFAWRNDPITLACMRSTAVVSREDHERWMQFHVMQGYPTHLVWMADCEHGSIGVVRFDSDRNDVLSYEASITIDPKFRGHGFAFPILAEACGYLPDCTISAEIRMDNAPSRRVFERCGFERYESREGFVQYRRKPLA